MSLRRVAVVRILDEMPDITPLTSGVRLNLEVFSNRLLVVRNYKIAGRFMGYLKTQFQPDWR